jgi:hypothetical protein
MFKITPAVKLFLKNNNYGIIISPEMGCPMEDGGFMVAIRGRRFQAAMRDRRR